MDGFAAFVTIRNPFSVESTHKIPSFFLGWDHLKLFFLVHRNTPFFITRSFDELITLLNYF